MPSPFIIPSTFPVTSFSSLFPSPIHTTIYTVSNLLTFKLLGGRGRYLAPSDIIKKGTFARRWITATLDEYADRDEKATIHQYGARYGCHHCGTHSSTYIGDHIPPNKYSKAGRPQLFLPQCPPCSTSQSHAVRLDRRFYVMPRVLKPYDIWLPISIITAIIAYPTVEYMYGRIRGRYEYEKHGIIKVLQKKSWWKLW